MKPEYFEEGLYNLTDDELSDKAEREGNTLAMFISDKVPEVHQARIDEAYRKGKDDGVALGITLADEEDDDNCTD